MKITQNVPTQEGWYWWRASEDPKYDWVMMQLVTDTDTNKLMVLSHTMKAMAPVDHIIGFWSGPIRTPKL